MVGKVANQLVVGDLSTWSLRAWLCLKLAGIRFDEIVIQMDAADYKAQILVYSDTGLVPVFIQGDQKIQDSLAIAEFANEQSTGSLLPEDAGQRALARSLMAELHSGFMALRSQCPFGLQPMVEHYDSELVADDVARLQHLWSNAASPYYFSHPGMVDAFYAVMAGRLALYDIWLTGDAGRYQKSLLAWQLYQDGMTAMASWCAG